MMTVNFVVKKTVSDVSEVKDCTVQLMVSVVSQDYNPDFGIVDYVISHFNQVRRTGLRIR